MKYAHYSLLIFFLMILLVGCPNVSFGQSETSDEKLKLKFVLPLLLDSSFDIEFFTDNLELVDNQKTALTDLSRKSKKKWLELVAELTEAIDLNKEEKAEKSAEFRAEVLGKLNEILVSHQVIWLAKVAQQRQVLISNAIHNFQIFVFVNADLELPQNEFRKLGEKIESLTREYIGKQKELLQDCLSEIVKLHPELPTQSLKDYIELNRQFDKMKAGSINRRPSVIAKWDSAKFDEFETARLQFCLMTCYVPEVAEYLEIFAEQRNSIEQVVNDFNNARNPKDFVTFQLAELVFCRN